MVFLLPSLPATGAYEGLLVESACRHAMLHITVTIAIEYRFGT